MHRYDCPQCELTSQPYFRRSAAEDKGADHRDKRHDGMYPKGESILVETFHMPRRAELKPFVIVAVVLLAGLVSKFL